MADSSYQTSDAEILDEVLCAAELRLQAQLTAALAADQRALVFAGFVAAAAVALAGGAASILLSMPSHRLVGYLALAAAAGLLCSMGLAIHAARPAHWYFPGGRPASWLRDIESGKAKQKRREELAADCDVRVAANEALMAANGKLLRASNLVALATLLIAGVIFLVYALMWPA